MIEREKKRIKLEKKYALKRASLLNQYRTEKNFNLKLELHSKLQKLPRNSEKLEFETDVGKLVDLEEFFEILDYHVML